MLQLVHLYSMVYAHQHDRTPRVDHLQRHLNALKVEDRADAAVLSLGAYVEAERRDLDNDAFANLDKEVQARVTVLAKR